MRITQPKKKMLEPKKEAPDSFPPPPPLPIENQEIKTKKYIPPKSHEYKNEMKKKDPIRPIKKKAPQNQQIRKKAPSDAKKTKPLYSPYGGNKKRMSRTGGKKPYQKMRSRTPKKKRTLVKKVPETRLNKKKIENKGKKTQEREDSPNLDDRFQRLEEKFARLKLASKNKKR